MLVPVTTSPLPAGKKRCGQKITVAICLLLCAGCVGANLSGTLCGWLQKATANDDLAAAHTAASDTSSQKVQGITNLLLQSVLENGGLVSVSSGAAPAQSSASSAEPTDQGAQQPISELLVQGGAAVEDFFVTDTTGAGLNLADELTQAPVAPVAAADSPTVFIYHTHTTEAYLSQESDHTFELAPTRSVDETQNIVAVGEAIAQVLRDAGIGVVHDTTVHDYPAYNGAYDRSYETIFKNLNQYPTISVTIDVHRDCMMTAQGLHYKPTAVVNGKKAAQVMIITGCDPDGSFGFPNWKDNLHFALRVQQKATRLYGELMRPLNFCERRYNMDATRASLLVEVGTEVNTLEEAKYSGTLIADAIAQVLLENSP